MAALVGGALLGAVRGELLRAILRTKEQASDFQPLFKRLEATLNSITPRLDQISRLNHKLDIQQDKQEELIAIIKDGTTLISKCSEISNFNYFMKVRYWKELSDLDENINKYFTTILPLDHFRMDLETFTVVKEMHQDLDALKAGLLAIQVHQEFSKKEEAKIMIKSYAKQNDEIIPPGTTKMYQRKTGKKLFLLEGCPYDLDLEDLESYDPVCKGTYATSYKCNTKYGHILVKSINLEVKVRESEFEQRMEDIGKVGNHPNVVLPFGYFSSEIAQFLLYDYAPAGSLYALLQEPKSLGTRPHWDRSLKIILGAARGISHIHSQGGIIHGNIKSSNVLVTADYDGFVSDFGLAPMINIPALTPELSALELKETGEATQKSDVYNFGVMLYEITSFYNMHILWHPTVATEEGQILLISEKCRQRDPNRRPTMDEVVRLIQNIRPSHGERNDVMQVARNFMELF